jgi:hypothetical protein
MSGKSNFLLETTPLMRETTFLRLLPRRELSLKSEFARSFGGQERNSLQHLPARRGEPSLSAPRVASNVGERHA